MGNKTTFRTGYNGTIPERMASKTDRSAGAKCCWPWIGSRDTGGYGQIKVGGRLRRAHRVAYELVNGPATDGRIVMHTCDNRACVNPAHLVLGTKLANWHDMYQKGRGRWLAGDDHPAAKLTPADIETIRASAATSTFTALAKRFSVDRRTIARVVKGETWR